MRISDWSSTCALPISLTIPILLTLSRDFGLDLDSLQTHDTPRLAASLREALGDPLFADEPAGLQEIKRAVAQAPSPARRFVEMHRAYRHPLDRLQSLADAIGGPRPAAIRLSWSEERYSFPDCTNYIGSPDTDPQ